MALVLSRCPNLRMRCHRSLAPRYRGSYREAASCIRRTTASMPRDRARFGSRAGRSRRCRLRRRVQVNAASGPLEERLIVGTSDFLACCNSRHFGAPHNLGGVSKPDLSLNSRKRWASPLVPGRKDLLLKSSCFRSIRSKICLNCSVFGTSPIARTDAK